MKNNFSISLRKDKELSNDLYVSLFHTPEIGCEYNEEKDVFEIFEKEWVKPNYEKERMRHERLYKRKRLGKPNTGRASLDFTFPNGKKRYIDLDMTINEKDDIDVSVNKILSKLRNRIYTILEEESPKESDALF